MNLSSYFRRVAAVGAVLLGLGVAKANAATFSVTNTDGAGAGSLRQAILDANGTANVADTIRFDATVFASPQTITLTGDLPEITSSLDIIGPTQKGTRVTIDDTTTDGTLGTFASAGGAVNFSVSDLTFMGRLAGVGHYASGTFSVQRCTFSATDVTGAVTTRATGLIQDCTFLNNRAGVQGFGCTVRNCTFVGNRYAIFQNRNPGSMTVESCTIAGNSTGVLGSGSVAVFNSLVVGNTNNTEQEVQFDAYSRNSGTAAQAGLQTSDGANAVVLQDNGGATETIALLPGGSAIDAGNSALVTDQRGRLRPVDFSGVPNASGGNGSDIGAFEWNETPQSGPNFVVNTSGDHNDTVCGPTDCTLREAIGAANTNNNPGETDTITFAQSVRGTISLNGNELVVSQGVTITGPGASLLTVSGNDASRVFSINAPGVTISGLTLSGGTAAGLLSPGSGGAIYSSEGSSLSLLDCILTGNRAVAVYSDIAGGDFSEGGAVSAYGQLNMTRCTVSNNSSDVFNAGVTLGPNATGDSTFTDCVFSDNTTAQTGGGITLFGKGDILITGCTFSGNTITEGDADGGGVFNMGEGDVTISSSTMTGNTARNGGAIYDDGSGTLTIENCTLSGNTARNGGGLYTSATTILRNSTVSGNTAIDGGAILSVSGTLTVENSTLFGNVANGSEYGGGAIDSYGPSAVTLSSCTITNNRAPNVANGTRSGILLEDGTLTLNNSIVAGNGAQDIELIGGTFSSEGFNLIGDPGAVTGFVASDKVGTDATPLDAGFERDSANGNIPFLKDNGGPTRTVALIGGSAAINAGATDLNVDQRGVARPQRGADDIGAFEYANVAPSISSAAISPSNPKTKDTLTATPSTATPTGSFDPEGDTLTFSYQWKNGDTVLSETGPTLDLSVAGNGDRGDTISVTVTANDGTASSAPATSNSVTVGNSAPVVESVSISPEKPSTTALLTATAPASDADGDTLELSYQWQKNTVNLQGETGATLDLSSQGNVADGDIFTVVVTATETSGAAPLASAPSSDSVTVSNESPSVVAVTPVGTTDAVGAKQTFSLKVSDPNSVGDISEMWLLINTELDWSGGATLVYFPKSGQLYLRRGDDFLPPIKIGAAAGASDVLDNGALRIVGSEVSVVTEADGNTMTLSVPATVRNGLVGQNTLFARVQDVAGGEDAAAPAGQFGFVNFGPYTVKPQFAGSTNTVPTLATMSPRAAFTVIPTTGTKLQTFVFYAKDEDGIGDLDSLWFMAGKQRDWTGSATFVFLPRTRRLYLRSDDGQSFLGGGQIGSVGTIENSQVKVDLSQVQFLIYGDGKSVGLRMTLQPKAGLIGQNQIWLRVQDNAGATSTGGDDVGFVQSGTWNVTRQSGSTINAANPSASGS